MINNKLILLLWLGSTTCSSPLSLFGLFPKLSLLWGSLKGEKGGGERKGEERKGERVSGLKDKISHIK